MAAVPDFVPSFVLGCCATEKMSLGTEWSLTYILKLCFHNLIDSCAEFQFKLSAENLKTIVYVHVCKCQKQGSKSGFQMPSI